MISSKDLFMEDRNASAAEMRLHREYEDWLQYQALLEWADNQVERAECFFLDLRQTGLHPVEIAAGDQIMNEEKDWFFNGDALAEATEARQIHFQTQWRISA